MHGFLLVLEDSQGLTPAHNAAQSGQHHVLRVPDYGVHSKTQNEGILHYCSRIIKHLMQISRRIVPILLTPTLSIIEGTFAAFNIPGASRALAPLSPRGLHGALQPRHERVPHRGTGGPHPLPAGDRGVARRRRRRRSPCAARDEGRCKCRRSDAGYAGVHVGPCREPALYCR